MKGFRDSLGRFCSARFFSQELELKKVKMKYSDGSRISGSRRGFILRVNQAYYGDREKLRSKRAYLKRKKEKATGKKIIREITAPPEIEVVGARGKTVKEKSKVFGKIRTYVRWSFLTRYVSGSDGISGRNAEVFDGSVSLNNALKYTQFYEIFNSVKPLIFSHEVTFVDGGIHYYRFQEDANGFRHIVGGSERKINGRDIMDV